MMRPIISMTTRSLKGRVPFCDVLADNRAIGIKSGMVLRSIHTSYTTGQYINGPHTQRFEQAFAEYLHVDSVVGVNSGTDALKIALQLVDVGYGMRVATIPTTSPATCAAIRAVGAWPVFIDVLANGHMDPVCLAKHYAIHAFDAIMPVHLYGIIDLQFPKIISFAKRNHLPVIEDACQAHGTMLNGKYAGTFGTVGCFSFYPTKNLGALGDAGAIALHDNILAEKAKCLRNYGLVDRNLVGHANGCNSRMDDIQAAVLLAKLGYLHQINERRCDVFDTYCRKLSSIQPIVIVGVEPSTATNHHLFVIKLPTAIIRCALLAHLRSRGITSFAHYSIPLNRLDVFRQPTNISTPAEETPLGVVHCDRVLSLPFYNTISSRQIARVCNAIKEFFHA